MAIIDFKIAKFVFVKETKLNYQKIIEKIQKMFFFLIFKEK